MKKISFTSFLMLINSKKLMATINKATDASNSSILRRKAANQLPKVYWSVGAKKNTYYLSGMSVLEMKIPNGMSKKQYFEKRIKPYIREMDIFFVYPDPVDDILYVGIKYDDCFTKKSLVATCIGDKFAIAKPYDEPTLLPPLGSWYYLDLKYVHQLCKNVKIVYNYERS